jgi:hypothetical protein
MNRAEQEMKQETNMRSAIPVEVLLNLLITLTFLLMIKVQILMNNKKNKKSNQLKLRSLSNNLELLKNLIT